MSSLMHRLDLYMAGKNLNDNKLTVLAGLSVGLLSKARKRDGVMSSDNIEKILLACPTLNANWLLTGRGEMIIGNESYKQGSVSNSAIDRLIESLNVKEGVINQMNVDHQEIKKHLDTVIKDISNK